MAINLYLASAYATKQTAELYPADPQTRAQIQRWSLWAQGHVEPFVQRDTAILAMRDLAGDDWWPALRQSLTTLERQLEGQAWLVGEAFTFADLNVAGVLSPSRVKDTPVVEHPRIVDWLARCYARPAVVATRARYA